jgi:AcrR family transcriptional regulator
VEGHATEAPRESQRQVQKRKTRAVLLDAAAKLFKLRGYQKTTIRSVAEASGVATGTVFTHFHDKFDLLVHILHQDLDAAVTAAWAELPQGELLPQLSFLVRRIYGFYFTDPELSRILLQEGVFAVPKDDDILANQVMDFLSEVAALFVTAQARGELRADVEVDVLCATYFSVYLMILSKHLKSEEPKLDTAVAEFGALFGEILRWGRHD